MGTGISTKCKQRDPYTDLCLQIKGGSPFVATSSPTTVTTSSNTSMSSTNTSLTVKVTLVPRSAVADTRKVTLKYTDPVMCTVDYHYLLEEVREKFSDRLKKFTPILLKYRDEDGELITITDQSDVNDFLATAPFDASNSNTSAESSQLCIGLEAVGPQRLYIEVLEEESPCLAPVHPITESTDAALSPISPLDIQESQRSLSPTCCPDDLSPSLNQSQIGDAVTQQLATSAGEPSGTPATAPPMLIGPSVHHNVVDFFKPHLPIRPVRKCTRGFLLGSGGCGKVYRAMSDDGTLIAVKQVEIQNHPNVAEDLQNLDREISALKMLEHANIVRYFGMYIEETEGYSIINLLIELVAGGSIAGLLLEMGPFSEQIIVNYTKQILVGLKYLHDNEIVHRDIKGGNILIDRRGNIKLSDFGASKRIADMKSKADGGDSNLKGTIKWMAPEVCTGGGGSKASDVWSLGCTVVEMATGDSPYPAISNPITALFSIGTGKTAPDIPAHLSTNAQDFLRRCFKQAPEERPTVEELQKHPWMTTVMAEEEDFVKFAESSLNSEMLYLRNARGVRTPSPTRSSISSIPGMIHSRSSPGPLSAQFRSASRIPEVICVQPTDVNLRLARGPSFSMETVRHFPPLSSTENQSQTQTQTQQGDTQIPHAHTTPVIHSHTSDIHPSPVRTGYVQLTE